MDQAVYLPEAQSSKKEDAVVSLKGKPRSLTTPGSFAASLPKSSGKQKKTHRLCIENYRINLGSRNLTKESSKKVNW